MFRNGNSGSIEKFANSVAGRTNRVIARIVAIIAVISLALSSQSYAGKVTVTINGQTPGPTPFISLLDVTVTQASALKSIQFTVYPKPSSVTRPVSATYSSAYLQRRGYLNLETGQITLPVFSLYASYSNTVGLTFIFHDHPAHRDIVTVSTAAFDDPTGVYTNPTVLQARSTRANLSYDYVMLKGFAAPISPIIIDTDGQVRWVGTAGLASAPAILFDNGIYVSSGGICVSCGTSITRMEFDGTFGIVADYATNGITSTGEHNFEYGKTGILDEVDTKTTFESEIIEVDRSGNVLNTWNLADIISAAMIAGGDDPSAFVRPLNDWFHSNSSTYRKSDDSLIVSSRENFVICLDYETGAIKWILGDPTKAWYQYPSLRKFALSFNKNTHPPIGQHALSITKDNELLLFDNGFNSLQQVPAGVNRTYSTPRKYLIRGKEMTAKEVWNYPRDESIYSPICSSVYEDRPRNYLIDYSVEGPWIFTEIVGLNPRREIVFDYRYPAVLGPGTAWNAVPIHLEKMVFE